MRYAFHVPRIPGLSLPLDGWFRPIMRDSPLDSPLSPNDARCLYEALVERDPDDEEPYGA